MKLNKLVLISILSFSLLFCFGGVYSADTSIKDYTQYKFGAVSASPTDKGTISLEEYLASSNQVLNSSINMNEYTRKLLPVLDQGPYSECVAYALRGIKDELSLNNEYHSAGFIYGHRTDGNTNEGMYSINALKSLKEHGTCLDSEFPDRGTFLELSSKITQSMIDSAKKHKIDGYIRLNIEKEIKTALINVSCVYITIPIYDSFFQGGLLVKPNRTTEIYFGGHALIIYGWKHDVINNKDYWLVKNSWGDWGSMRGYCLMPFDYPIKEYWCLVDSDESKLPPDPLSKLRKLDITSELNTTKAFYGDSLQLNAIANNNYKTEEYVTDKAEWSTSNPSIATIDSNGLLIANSIGKVKVTAKYLNKTDTKYITIVDTNKYYSIQILSTKIENDAEKLVDELINKRFNYDIYVNQIGNYYKVTIGNFADKNEANDVRRIMKDQWEFKNARVVFIREDV